MEYFFLEFAPNTSASFFVDHNESLDEKCAQQKADNYDNYDRYENSDLHWLNVAKWEVRISMFKFIVVFALRIM